jgi:bifunctional NMN adenylyltransferase/nudix hydrolase
MKTGIIIARFQVARLTKGHKFLIMKVLSKHKKIIILLGVPPVEYTNVNPLTFLMRRRVVEEAFPVECLEKKITFLPLYDFPGNNVAWSNQIDALLGDVQKPVIYYSREGFGDTYSGIYRTKKLKSLKESPSGTDQRTVIAKMTNGNASFRAGVIHAIENKFPTVFPTVDVALLKVTQVPLGNNTRGFGVRTEVLLGRKQGKDKWVFPGGFVDPTDEILESAAKRELKEETGVTETHGFAYVCSKKVNDGRYNGTKDGVMTTFFKTYFMGGKEPIAGDDLEEVRWVNMPEIERYISPHHLMLAKQLIVNLTGEYSANPDLFQNVIKKENHDEQKRNN